MSIILLLLSSAVLAFMFAFWKTRFQRNNGGVSSNPASSALVRTTSSRSPSSNTDSLSVRNLSRDILCNFPHSIAIQKRILVNLRIVEYKLAELEHYLTIKGLNGALVNWKSTGGVTGCNNRRGNH